MSIALSALQDAAEILRQDRDRVLRTFDTVSASFVVANHEELDDRIQVRATPFGKDRVAVVKTVNGVAGVGCESAELSNPTGKAVAALVYAYLECL